MNRDRKKVEINSSTCLFQNYVFVIVPKNVEYLPKLCYSAYVFFFLIPSDCMNCY